MNECHVDGGDAFDGQNPAYELLRPRRCPSSGGHRRAPSKRRRAWHRRVRGEPLPPAAPMSSSLHMQSTQFSQSRPRAGRGRAHASVSVLLLALWDVARGGGHAHGRHGLAPPAAGDELRSQPNRDETSRTITGHSLVPGGLTPPTESETRNPRSSCNGAVSCHEGSSGACFASRWWRAHLPSQTMEMRPAQPRVPRTPRAVWSTKRRVIFSATRND